MKNIYKIIFFLLMINQSCNLLAQKNIPEWAEGIIWYQIFPERFANGDANNDPEAEKVFINQKKIPDGWGVTPWTNNWFAQSEWEIKAGGKISNHLVERRYGGDIQGILDHLDYLQKLGIGAIYLNPIFEAVSMHKYDGSSYHHIDVNFGPDPVGDRLLIESETPDDPSTWKWTKADQIFLKLIDEIHSRGMRIIIDGVFNHTGVQFWAFKDIVKNGKNSKYSDWYIIHKFDDASTNENEFDYKGWWNAKSLPEFNRTKNDLHPGPKQYIFHSTKRWMDPNNDGDCIDGIDGWRLDVARDVPIGFWRDWNKLVKSTNPEAIIVGELWELSPEYISDDGVFDALMNYNFAFAVNDFFIAQKNKITASEFIERLKKIDTAYPKQYLNLLQNLVDSHDTERISSMIMNPDRQYDRDGSNENHNYNPGKPTKEAYELQKLIVAFQMTYRGAPMIYYGDEVGMWGADDPHTRKPMVWGELKYEDEIITEKSDFKKGFGSYKVEQNKELLDYYKLINNFRSNNLALQKGSLEFLYSNDEKNVVAFSRTFEDEKVIAIFNVGTAPDNFIIPLDAKEVIFKELFSGENGILKSDETAEASLIVTITPGSVKIFKLIKSI